MWCGIKSKQKLKRLNWSISSKISICLCRILSNSEFIAATVVEDGSLIVVNEFTLSRAVPFKYRRITINKAPLKSVSLLILSPCVGSVGKERENDDNSSIK